MDEDRSMNNKGELRCSGGMCENTRFFWRIDNFSKLSQDPDEFYVYISFPFADYENIRFKMELYPKGLNRERTGLARLFIQILNKMSESYDFKLMYSIRNIDGETIICSGSKSWVECKPGLLVDHITIPRKILLRNLKNDIAIIVGDIVYTKSIVRDGRMVRHLHLMSPYVSLVNDYSNIAARPDVVIVAGDAEIPAHSVVLIARSEVFTNILAEDENHTHRIHISGFHADIVNSMVEFLYSGGLDDANLMPILSLLQLADKYRIDSLMSYCICFLTAHVTKPTAMEILLATSSMRNERIFGIREAAIICVAETFSADDLRAAYPALERKPDALFDLLAIVLDFQANY